MPEEIVPPQTPSLTLPPADTTLAPTTTSLPTEVIEPSTPSSETPPVVAPGDELDYEIELAEDTPLSDEDLTHISAFVEANKLTKSQAQSLIAQKEGVYKRGFEASQSARNSELETRRATLNSAPEFSGDEAKTSWSYVNKAVEVFGSDKMRETLSMNPDAAYDLELAKFLRNIGKALYGDTPLEGKGASSPTSVASEETARLRRSYPSMFGET